MLLGVVIVSVVFCVSCVNAQGGFITLNARAMSDTQVLISRYDVGANMELATLDFAFRPSDETRWRSMRYNPTREYFAFTQMNSSTLYYFRLTGRLQRTYHFVYSYTHIQTPPYTQKPPSNVTAVAQPDDSVLVSWSQELDGRVLGYLVIYTEVDSKDRLLTEYKVKPVFKGYQTVLRDIKARSRYKVEVASVSMGGEGVSRSSVFLGEQKAPYLRITIPPRNEMVTDEGTLILVCKAEGYPTPTITWRKSGRMFDERKRRFFEDAVDGMSILRIDPVISRQDRGSYTCIAENGFGTRERARAVVKTYKEKSKIPGYPRVFQHPSLQYVEEGSDVTMNCSSEGTPEIITRWYRNSFPVYYSKDNRVALGMNAQLIISGVKKSDEGTYECSAENELGVSFSYPAHLYVRERIRKTTPPKFVRHRRRHRTRYGGEVTMTCDAVGEPVPEVWWELEGTRLKGRSHNGQNVILVQNLKESGVYTCVAANPLDIIRRNYTVTVDLAKEEEMPQAPTFKRSDLSANVKYGGSINLICEAEGDPTPSVVWTLGSSTLKRKSVNGKNVLYLEDLTRSATYTCTASNTEGKVSQDYVVTVGAKPVLADEPVNLQTSRVGFDDIEVTWESPAKAGSSVSGFVVYIRDTNTRRQQRFQLPLVFKHTFTNLKPNRGYDIRVAAVVQSVEGKSTPPKRVKTIDYVPETVTKVTARATDTTTILVEWQKLADRGSRTYVVGVDVVYKRLDSTGAVRETKVMEYFGSNRRLFIRSLESDTSYVIQVRAKTKTTEGPLSAPVTVVTEGESR